MAFTVPADTELLAAQRRADELRPHLARVAAVFTGKGGAGKTAIAANCGGLLALSAAATGTTRRVAIVDLDTGGSLALNLGYKGTAADDDGAGLVAAMTSGAAPHIIRDVRPNLDVIPGGMEMARIPFARGAEASMGRPNHARLMLAEVLAQLAHDYEWIILDCPALAATDVVDMALVASRAALVPVGICGGSVAGLEGVARMFGQAAQLNPALDLLGLAMFAFTFTDKGGAEVGARKWARAEFARYLREAGSSAPVFAAVIRHSETVAIAERQRGQLAFEIQGAPGPKWWELRAGTAAGRPVPNRQAATVAQEYEALTLESFGRFLELEEVFSDDGRRSAAVLSACEPRLARRR